MKRINYKKSKNVRFLIGLIIVIGIGFALLRANLEINGTAKIDAVVRDIHWKNLSITDGSVAEDNVVKAAQIKENKTEIEYSIVLPNRGDFYEFTVLAENLSSYDAMISVIEKQLYNSNNQAIDIPEYLDFKATYSDGSNIRLKDKLESNQSEMYKVRIAYKDNITWDEIPEGDTAITIKFGIEYAIADNTSRERNHDFIRILKGKKGNLKIGDEIKIGQTEEFYVINSDNTENGKTTLLSKYNLYIGNILDGNGTYQSTISEDDSKYLKQNKNAKGYIPGEESVGVVPFSSKTYWLDNGSLKPEFGEEFPVSIYRNQYNTKPTFNSDGTITTENYSIAYYVNQYVNKLEEEGTFTSVVGKILSMEEARQIKCDVSELYCFEVYPFSYNISSWIDAADNNYVLGISTSTDIDKTNMNGIRVVLIINTSDVE